MTEIDKNEQEYWEKILTEAGFDMSRGSVQEDPQQKRAIAMYVENMECKARDEEVREGFQIEDVTDQEIDN